MATNGLDTPTFSLRAFCSWLTRFCNDIDEYMVGSLRDPELGGDLPFSWILRSILSPLSFLVRIVVVVSAPFLYLLGVVMLKTKCLLFQLEYVWKTALIVVGVSASFVLFCIMVIVVLF